MAKLWGGRFSQDLDASAKALSYGIDIDKRLFVYDLAVNKAHAKALVGAGILTEAEYNSRYKEIISTTGGKDKDESVFSTDPKDFKVSYTAAKAKFDELQG